MFIEGPRCQISLQLRQLIGTAGANGDCEMKLIRSAIPVCLCPTKRYFQFGV